MGDLIIQTVYSVGLYTDICCQLVVDNTFLLYFSVSDTWENCLNGAVDVKELIPEFYQPPGDFLLNKLVSVVCHRFLQPCLACGSIELESWYEARQVKGASCSATSMGKRCVCA